MIQLKASDVKDLRDKILEEQNKTCPICNRIITDAVLDHSHKKKTNGSGLIRGVLCRTCNVLLGKIENNCRRYKIDNSELPDVLRNIANYLEKEHYPYIHPSEKEVKKLTKSSYNKLKKVYSGRAKFPEYTGRFSKKIEKLFIKYNVEPVFY